MSKKSVLVVFGGSSFEHRISLDSAQTVIDWLDKSKYDIATLGISKTGKCIIWPQAMNFLLEESSGYNGSKDLFVLEHHANTCKGFIESLASLPAYPDVIFPIIHGFNGEDGRLQGMLDLVGVPYVWSGVIWSAICMDKVMTKAILEKFEIPQLPYVGFTDFDWHDAPEKVRGKIESLEYPIFIKPANLGSSIGISKVHWRNELDLAIKEALKFDKRILAEKGLVHPKEIEVAILWNHNFTASVAWEIIIDTKYEFYTYEAKYIDFCATKCQIPAQIPDFTAAKLQHYAKEACRAVNVKGLTRVDFFVDKDTWDCYLNELNTIPDFTIDSMFPSLWKESGLEYSQLLDTVIDLALKK